MRKWIKSKLSLNADFSNTAEYEACIDELIRHEVVGTMKNFIQHYNITCLEHSLYVSYTSYLVCKQMGLDYHSAARGGLLHDFFLYDWHKDKPEKGLHGFVHPYIALENANKYFCLNEIERDIIVKHMWPLTIRPPKYRESFVVTFADKYCAAAEVLNLTPTNDIYKCAKQLAQAF